MDLVTELNRLIYGVNASLPRNQTVPSQNKQILQKLAGCCGLSDRIFATGNCREPRDVPGVDVIRNFSDQLPVFEI